MSWDTFKGALYDAAFIRFEQASSFVSEFAGKNF